MSKLKDNVSAISRYFDRSEVSSSMAAKLMQLIESKTAQVRTPMHYFYVTDLVNPIRKYWADECPNVKRPEGLTRKLNYGKTLQDYAGPWFRIMGSFIEEEGVVDGAFVDIPGVRGKIDYLFKESIVEFKTKSEEGLPKDEKDIIERFPQDLEQLLFYSALLPTHPKCNYLVFMESKEPYTLVSFKLTTLDFHIIEETIRARIKMLKEAQEKKDWKLLGKCRYIETCEFQETGVCSCGKMKPLDISTLVKSIRIETAPKFNSELELCRKQYKTKVLSGTYSPANIIAPRRYVLNRVRGVPFEQYAEFTLYESCLWRSIKELGYNLSETQAQKIKGEQKEPRLRIPFRWLKLPSSQKEDDIVPYIHKVSANVNIPFKPSPYHVAELAIICSAYGKQRGLVILLFPKKEKQVKVFDVRYKDVANLSSFVSMEIDKLEKAAKDNAIVNLVPCPSFMNKERKCQLDSECYAADGERCLYEEI